MLGAPPLPSSLYSLVKVPQLFQHCPPERTRGILRARCTRVTQAVNELHYEEGRRSEKLVAGLCFRKVVSPLLIALKEINEQGQRKLVC